MTEPNSPNYSPFDVGFGIYVHWPFCLAKCPYCDFNSHVRHHRVDTKAFTSGLVAELKHFYQFTSDRKASSIFFGGGTPSLMPPQSVETVISTVNDLWGLTSDAEITLEANPTSAEAGRFSAYRNAGVNRASVGVQALDDKALKALGRQHNTKEALGAFGLAANIFERTSFDLIYARPDQTLADWRQELTRALAEQSGHMSLYQLTIEPDTAFEKLYQSGKLHIPDDDRAAALYDITQELTAKAGLEGYEISNHAAPGNQSAHNLLYWQYGEYAGVGAGAHARIITPSGRIARANEKHPEKWLDLVNKTGSGAVTSEHLSQTDQAREFLLMGLRLTRGIDLKRFQSLFNRTLAREKIADLAEQRLIVINKNAARIAATQKGMRVLNAIIAYLDDV